MNIAPTGYTTSAIFNGLRTKAVVATWVVFVPATAVVALNAWEALPAKSALVLIAVCTAVNSVLKSAPDITLLVKVLNFVKKHQTHYSLYLLLILSS